MAESHSQSRQIGPVDDRQGPAPGPDRRPLRDGAGDMTDRIARRLVEICAVAAASRCLQGVVRQGQPDVGSSYRGPGLDEGMKSSRGSRPRPGCR